MCASTIVAMLWIIIMIIFLAAILIVNEGGFIRNGGKKWKC